MFEFIMMGNKKSRYNHPFIGEAPPCRRTNMDQSFYSSANSDRLGEYEYLL